MLLEEISFGFCFIHHEGEALEAVILAMNTTFGIQEKSNA